MQASTNVQHSLPPLAAAFSFPGLDSEFSARIDTVIAAGEHAVAVIFKDIRAALAEGEGERNPEAMQTLAGLMGTGITLLETHLAMAENAPPLKRAQLCSLLDEYKKLFEDIELFAADIPAADCFLASCVGAAFSDLNTPEEDALWQDL